MGLAMRAGGDGPVIPRFVDEATAAGVDHVYAGEFPFFVGGGVAAFDCNDDGFADLYLAGGAEPAALYVNRSEVGGSLQFEQLDNPLTDLDAVTGAYPIDIDSDEVMDLVVLRRGANVVLRGTGDCGFEDVTERLGLAGPGRWTVGFSARWEGDATLPTLAFGNYLVPDTYDCDVNEIYRQASVGGSGSPPFYDAPIELASHCTLSMLFSDWAHDGNADLRVSNDRNYDRDAKEQLWRVREGEVPVEYGEADGWKRLTIWGMGIASRDLTGDGRPEVFLSSQADNKLQSLDDGVSGPSYSDIALARGVTAQRPYTGDDVLPSTAWAPVFADVDNDGLVDLFVAKGNVDAQPDYARNDPNNLLLGMSDGTFADAGAEAGIATPTRSRGAVLVDLNLDGLLDIVVVNRRVQAELWRNLGSGDASTPRPLGNWVQLQVRQPAPNTAAIGAWVEVRVGGRVDTVEITVGGGHAGGSSGWLHFGLGDAASAEVRVTFPGATPGRWMTVTANSFWTIDREVELPSAWLPPR